jgi:hypothetical protein
VQLAPAPAYDELWQVPIQKDPWDVPLEEKIDMLRGVTATMQKNPSVLFAVASVGFEHEWKYLATSEGSFIDAELIIRAMRQGHRVVQFGVDYFPRTRGISTLSSPAVIKKLLTEMMMLRKELRGI